MFLFSRALFPIKIKKSALCTHKGRIFRGTTLLPQRLPPRLFYPVTGISRGNLRRPSLCFHSQFDLSAPRFKSYLPQQLSRKVFQPWDFSLWRRCFCVLLFLKTFSLRFIITASRRFVKYAGSEKSFRRQNFSSLHSLNSPAASPGPYTWKTCPGVRSEPQTAIRPAAPVQKRLLLFPPG